jgi:hypothetical protein
MPAMSGIIEPGERNEQHREPQLTAARSDHPGVHAQRQRSMGYSLPVAECGYARACNVLQLVIEGETT